MNGIDEYEYRGDGYMRQVNGAKWTLAALNYAERFDEKNIVDLERHNLTDETFVLLEGEATLLTAGVSGASRPGEPTRDASGTGAPVRVSRVPMTPLRYYNVRAGIWHNIVVKPGTRCLVAENANTSKDNTDYLEIATGRVFKKRPSFEEILPGTYLLKVPFGPVWTGIALVKYVSGASRPGAETADAGRVGYVLIDSSHLDPEPYLIPALAELGLRPGDIDWLLNTHVHGDHIGGHHALVTKYGLKTCTLDSAADALRDPVKVAVRVRTRFPKNSPAPQSYLKGVEPDKVLKEGELLEGRFMAIATPGHDDDCLTWIDTVTGTAFTGDSLQANGTPTQGVGFYRDLPAYRRTLAKLAALVPGASRPGIAAADARRVGYVSGASRPGIENIVCGHFYDGIGDVIKGRDEVSKALAYCESRVALYGERLKSYVTSLVSQGPGRDAPGTGGRPGRDAPGMLPTRLASALPESGRDAPGTDEAVLVPLALKLIGEVGCGMPESLFLALHTVSEHLKEIGQ